ncbi:MAG: nicotinate-nucleotide adenylyltransferase [Pseudomonadota bacterium]
MLVRRALFGGTFDPVHHGHLAAAGSVREALAIEDFRFLPAGSPPHRAGTYASGPQRLRMLELALEERPEFAIDHRELLRPGPSYMSDTLASVRGAYPDDALILVLGQDALNSLDRWHDWRRIPKLSHLAVMTRPGETPAYSDPLAQVLEAGLVGGMGRLAAEQAGAIVPVAVTPMDISSTALRAEVGNPRRLRHFVPDAVAAYIEAEGLYGLSDL